MMNAMLNIINHFSVKISWDLKKYFPWFDAIVDFYSED
jgi:hypothetical protein